MNFQYIFFSMVTSLNTDYTHIQITAANMPHSTPFHVLRMLLLFGAAAVSPWSFFTGHLSLTVSMDCLLINVFITVFLMIFLPALPSCLLHLVADTTYRYTDSLHYALLVKEPLNVLASLLGTHLLYNSARLFLKLVTRGYLRPTSLKYLQTLNPSILNSFHGIRA